MAHLIDKDALVAKIEKRRDEHFNSAGSPSSEYCYEDDEILSIIDTFKVKKVDLEKEIEKYCRKYYNCNYPDQIQSGKCSEVMPHIVEAARRFFELGLKAHKGE